MARALKGRGHVRKRKRDYAKQTVEVQALLSASAGKKLHRTESSQLETATLKQVCCKLRKPKLDGKKLKDENSQRGETMAVFTTNDTIQAGHRLMDRPPPPSLSSAQGQSVELFFYSGEGRYPPPTASPWHVPGLISVEMWHRWRARAVTSRRLMAGPLKVKAGKICVRYQWRN